MNKLTSILTAPIDDIREGAYSLRLADLTEPAVCKLCRDGQVDSRTISSGSTAT